MLYNLEITGRKKTVICEQSCHSLNSIFEQCRRAFLGVFLIVTFSHVVLINPPPISWQNYFLAGSLMAGSYTKGL